MRSSIIPKAFAILAGAIVIGGSIGWFASRNASDVSAPAQESPAESQTTDNTTTENKTDFVKSIPNAAPVVAIQPADSTTSILDDPALWEEKLDDILLSDSVPENKKGEQLLELMGKVGMEAQIELAGHAVNLLDDDQFHLAAKYLTNAAVAEDVSSVFMNDLYNRDDAIKLPLILEVARNEQHVLRDEARDLLELYVEEDHGTNWVQWEAAMKKYLQEQEELNLDSASAN